MCESANLIPKKAVEHYHYKGQDFSLEDIEYAECPACHSEIVMPEQIKRNEVRIFDEHRKIEELRKRFNITQSEVSKMNENPLTTLKKALESYDETINIVKKSTLDDENRKTLACAYINRGDVLQTLGKLENENLAEALLSYDKAIHLAKVLPFEANRKILADAYLKRGDVLRNTGTQALETLEELADRRKRYSELAAFLQEQVENGDAEYDERVGSLLEKELATPL